MLEKLENIGAVLEFCGNFSNISAVLLHKIAKMQVLKLKMVDVWRDSAKEKVQNFALVIYPSCSWIN